MVNGDFPYAVASSYFPPRSVDHRKELFAAATGRCWEESRAEAWRASQYGWGEAGVVEALFVGNSPTNTTVWNSFSHTLLNANEWPDAQCAPWEALLDQLHEFWAAQGTSSLRTTLIQQLSMLTKHTS